MRKMKTTAVVTGFALAALSLSAMAADVTWTAGDGLYTNGANWGGTAPTDDTTTDVAVLTGGTVDLDTTRQVSGLNFSSGSTLSGAGSIETGVDGITVSGDSTIGTAGLVLNQATGITLNGNLGISSVLTGTGDLTVTAGTATDFSMTGVNGNDSSSGYSGNIVFDGINATVGRYFVGNTGGANTLSLLNGSTLNASDHLQMGSRNIVISGGARINQWGSNNIYGLDGIISGTGGLTFGHVGGGNGDKVQLQGNANTFTGGVTIDGTIVDNLGGTASLGDAANTVTFDNGGTLRMGGNNYLGNRDMVLTGDGTLDVDTNIDYTGAITGSGNLTIETTAEQRWAGSSNADFTGGVTIDGVTGGDNHDAGSVRINADTFGSGDITLKNNGMIKNQNSSFTLDNNIILEETGGQVMAGWSNRRITLSGAISGYGPLTIANDSSEVYISGTGNTYAGGTKILGNLAAENAGSLGTGAITFDGGFLRNDNSNIDLGTRDIIIDEGGAEIQIGWSNRRIAMDGVVSGTGKITVMDDSSTLILNNGGNTYAGGTEIRGFVQASSGGLGTGDVTLSDVNGSRGQLKNNGGAATHANNVIVDANGGRMQAGWDADLTINGIVSGAGGLVIAGDSGTVVLANENNTYSGDIWLDASTSRLSLESLGAGATIGGTNGGLLTITGAIALDSVSSYEGLTTISSGASIGGNGSLAGDLTLAAGAGFIFGESDTLTVAGTLTLDSSFGMDDVYGLTGSTTTGAYTIVSTVGDFSGIENFGYDNRVNVGGTREAYFENGSLQLVVIPEPAVLSIITTAGIAMLFIRRRFM